MKNPLDTSLNDLSETQSFYVEKKKKKDIPEKRNQTVFSDMSQDISPRNGTDLLISKAKNFSKIILNESDYSIGDINPLKSPPIPSKDENTKKPSALANYLKSGVSSIENTPPRARMDVSTSGFFQEDLSEELAPEQNPNSSK